eukprot:7831905-Prorocentrum_lima.AAC.1
MRGVISIAGLDTAWTCPRSVLYEWRTAICGMPGVRRVRTQSVALTCWRWPITMPFPLAFVERGK